jgi:hypothetical protein
LGFFFQIFQRDLELPGKGCFALGLDAAFEEKRPGLTHIESLEGTFEQGLRPRGKRSLEKEGASSFF